MILILGDKSDYCLNMVLDWIDWFKIDYLLLDNNSSITIKELNLENDEFKFYVGNKIVDFKKVSAILNWRGSLDSKITKSLLLDKTLPIQIREHLNMEWLAIRNYILELFKKKDGIGNLFFFNPNKLSVLKKASVCGLKIPTTYISSFREQLISTIDNTISKPISEMLSFNEGNYIYDMFTALNDVSFLQNKEEIFFPSLIQENITKKFELRIFFLDTNFFTLAFFSQELKETSVDTRRINFSTPIRIIPFQLPEKIDTKLRLLIHKLRIDTGSIDMIVTPDNEYVFLEINPWGYFNLHIEFGNYPVDYLIAKKLNYLNNEYKNK